MTRPPDTDPSVEPDFDPETGLIPAVVQDVESGRVRMLAYMNRESLERTRRTGRVTFYSRSREELWEKGKTSGNWLEARAIELDCDGDALVVHALPHGPTCHTGRESCFDGPRLWQASPGQPPGNARRAPAEVPADADRRPGGSEGGDEDLGAVLAELREVVAERDRRRPQGSYTVRLLEAGPGTAGRKVAEEALEVALATVAEPDRADEESADLLYHLLVLWRSLGLDAAEVARVLSRRRASPGPDDSGNGPEGQG